MFSFEWPGYASECILIFPGPISFDQPFTALCFDVRWGKMKYRRNKADLLTFLQAVPRYWWFATLNERLAA